jgi:hypothetical protein
MGQEHIAPYIAKAMSFSPKLFLLHKIERDRGIEENGRADGSIAISV